MNDKYYEDEPVFKIRPTHIKKQRKPPYVREFEYFSPKLLNKEPVPSEREGYYLYFYMESYYTSHTEKKGDKSVKVYKKHVSKKSVEVTLDQWTALHKGDCEDYADNRREYEKLEYEPKNNDRYVSTLDVMLQHWDKFEHEQFWVNAFDLERILNTLSDEDLDVYLYAKEKHLKQKQIAVLIGKSESYVNEKSTNYQLLVVLFPTLDSGRINSYHGEPLNIHQLKSRGRICFIDNFDYYFSGQLLRNGISKDDVKKVLYFNGFEENNEYFSKLNNRSYNMLLQFLYGISQDKKHIDKIALFLPVLMEYNLKFKSLTGFLILNNSHWIDAIIENIYKAFGKDKMLEYLTGLYNSSNDYGTLIDNIYNNAKGTDFYFNDEQDPANFTLQEIEALHAILIARLKKEMESSDFIEIQNLELILFFIKKRNSDILQSWYNAQSDKLLNIIDKLVHLGYGESTKRFRTYSFSHEVFDEYVDIELIKKKVNLYIRASKGSKENPELLLGKILFIMPEVKNNAYELSDIMDFCKQNDIDFSYKDIFIDE